MSRLAFLARFLTGTPTGVLLIFGAEVVSWVSRFCKSNMSTGHRSWPVRLECWFFNTSLDVAYWVWRTDSKAKYRKYSRTEYGSSIRAFYW